MGKLIYEDATYAIKGAVFEVYKTMGMDFLNRNIKNVSKKN